MRFARLLTVGLALVMTASGCTSEPSLKDAAAELQKDTQRLETDDVFKNPLMNLRIVQRPDKDLPCGGNKVKRVLRATADEERADESLDSRLDKAQRVMENTLSQVMGYRVEYDISQVDAPDGRFIYGRKEIGVTVNVYVSPEAPTWRLHAQTACLSQ
ncbi:hypothetical protein [Streptosporangium sp. NBC_01756]|uniref:hypothetical protein n=1 Tax=Streptosporangium sp. NBC_01756 TaxID=2975950 RepID=UPI002DDB755F|nr:hypothetical protein [Streptosporangium sp. NBC_01756]WSC85222.1 hypothetical protein OIE48_33450 [Streptosporangium sp. NBC_01756]